MSYCQLHPYTTTAHPCHRYLRSSGHLRTPLSLPCCHSLQHYFVLLVVNSVLPKPVFLFSSLSPSVTCPSPYLRASLHNHTPNLVIPTTAASPLHCVPNNHPTPEDLQPSNPTNSSLPPHFPLFIQMRFQSRSSQSLHSIHSQLFCPSLIVIHQHVPS